jgi:hypothetical protein
MTNIPLRYNRGLGHFVRSLLPVPLYFWLPTPKDRKWTQVPRKGQPAPPAAPAACYSCRKPVCKPYMTKGPDYDYDKRNLLPAGGLITAAVNNHRTKWLISLCGIIGVWVISCDHCYRSLCTSDYHVGISKFLLCRKNHVIPQTSSSKMTLQRNLHTFVNTLRNPSPLFRRIGSDEVTG